MPEGDRTGGLTNIDAKEIDATIDGWPQGDRETTNLLSPGKDGKIKVADYEVRRPDTCQTLCWCQNCLCYWKFERQSERRPPPAARRPPLRSPLRPLTCPALLMTRWARPTMRRSDAPEQERHRVKLDDWLLLYPIWPSLKPSKEEAVV